MIYKNLKSLLNISRSTVYILIIYSILLGVLSLTIPLSIQTLVNLINVSLSIRPIISLMIILSILLMTSFAVRLLQVYLVESIERSVFVNLSIRVYQHINKIKLSVFSKQNITEKVNRFFEIPSLQKSISILFIILLDTLLQMIFCVIVLALYHPLFLAFDIVLVCLVLISIFVPFLSAYRTGLKESESKYAVSAWIEGAASAPILFRQANIQQQGTKVLDKKLCDYLDNRQQHFRFLLKHHIYIGITYVFVNVLVLGLGSYLVVKAQLSVGQLIAAELLVNVVLLNLVKFSYYINGCYDFLVGASKIKDVLELPCQYDDSEYQLQLSKVTNFKIISDHESYDLEFNNNELITTLELTRSICGDLILSLLQNEKKDSLRLFVNDLDLSLYSRESVNKQVILTRGLEFIDGTVSRNITLDVKSLTQVDQILVSLDLEHLNYSLSKNIDSQTIMYDFYDLSYSDLAVLSILRSIVVKPKLLILVDVVSLLEKPLKSKVLSLIQELEIPTVIIR